MAIEKISIETFLHLSKSFPVADVRSPGEYNHAHIPGAYSLPLFTDEERSVVGTLYKQENREKAIKKGLEFFGVEMIRIVEAAEVLYTKHFSGKELLKNKTLLIHCWRGGMRSAGVAWLLDLYGFKVYTLAGGYKSFRHWVLSQFEHQYPFKIIGGYTGSGKTVVLAEMKKMGLKTIDLEELAQHKGSAFGAINMPPQPSQEMFENKLAISLSEVSKNENTASDIIYLEDESQRIGQVNLPINLWQQMRRMPIYFLQIPFEQRLQYIVIEYGKGEKEKLVNAIIRIKKRLGGLETKTAINFLLEDNVTEAFRVLLVYYDKVYKKGLQSREDLAVLCTELFHQQVDGKFIARQIFLNETKEVNV